MIDEELKIFTIWKIWFCTKIYIGLSCNKNLKDGKNLFHLFLILILKLYFRLSYIYLIYLTRDDKRIETIIKSLSNRATQPKYKSIAITLWVHIEIRGIRQSRIENYWIVQYNRIQVLIRGENNFRNKFP